MLEDMHVLLPLGSVFLGFTTNSFFHVVGILKQHSFYLKMIGKTCWNEYLQWFFSIVVQAYPKGSAVDRQVGTAVPSCSLQLFML